MLVLFESGGPLEGFVTSAFQTLLGGYGYGRVVADPTVSPFDGLDAGDAVTCVVEGTDRFVWTVEERDVTSDDHDLTTFSGRGRGSQLERAVVLPAGYPSFTVRERNISGAPLKVFLDLLAEAQSRGRLSWLTPSFTATHDSDGVAWVETVDAEIEPGATLAELLDEMTAFEDAEWLLHPDGTLDVAKQIGVDRSSTVTLFVGRHQQSRGRRVSARDVRDTVYVEASTGVSEGTNVSGGGEIWLQAQDFADPSSRAAVADRFALKLGVAAEEVVVKVSADCGVFDTFQVGDRVGLDVGGTVETVRVVAVTVTVIDQVDVELTLVSAVQLRQAKLDAAIEAKADVRLAANTTLQRRHGLVRADRIEAGSLQVDSFIGSSSFVSGTSGWKIDGAGDAEFNDVTVRGDIDASTITGSDISGSEIIAAGGAVEIGVSGIKLTTGITDLSAIRWVNGGVLWGRDSGQFIISPGSVSDLQSGYLDVRAATISLAGAIDLSGPVQLLAGQTLIGLTSSVIGVRGSNVDPASTTQRALFDWSAPRVLAVADSNAAAVFGRNSDGTVVNFRRSGSTVGSISVTTSATAYNTSSDVRLKDDVADADGALERVRQLLPRTWRWKADGTYGRGLVAQEVREVIPEIVSENDDGMFEVAYGGSALIADLVGAVQTLTAKVEALENR